MPDRQHQRGGRTNQDGLQLLLNVASLAMTATVMTISPRVPVREHERRARDCVAREGVALFAAATADRRQLRHLRRLVDRLAADDLLDVTVGEIGNATEMTVYLRAERQHRRGLGVLGEPKTDPRTA
jgi:hypothetical protein